MSQETSSKDSSFVLPNPEVVSFISGHLRAKASDLLTYMHNREHPYSLVGNRFSSEEIQHVQHLIELCLELYVTKFQIIAALHASANVEPGFTHLVWQKLEEQNQTFFEAYKIRCHLKEQILLFNNLVQKQAQVCSQIPTYNHDMTDDTSSMTTKPVQTANDPTPHSAAPSALGISVGIAATSPNQRSRLVSQAPPKLDVAMAQKLVQSKMGSIVMGTEQPNTSQEIHPIETDPFFQFTPTSNQFSQNPPTFESPNAPIMHIYQTQNPSAYNFGSPNIFPSPTAAQHYHTAQAHHQGNPSQSSTGANATEQGTHGHNHPQNSNTQQGNAPKPPFLGGISPMAPTGISPLSQLFPGIVYLSPVSGHHHKFPASYISGYSPTAITITTSSPSTTAGAATNNPSIASHYFPSPTAAPFGGAQITSMPNPFGSNLAPIVAVRPMTNQSQGQAQQSRTNISQTHNDEHQ